MVQFSTPVNCIGSSKLVRKMDVYVHSNGIITVVEVSKYKFLAMLSEKETLRRLNALVFK